MFGISDSEKQGWFTKESINGTHTARIEVGTPLGDIIAEVSGDSYYPGVFLSFRANGDTYERTIALMEASAPDTVDIKIWKDERVNEEYQHCFQVEKSKPATGIEREIAELESILGNPKGRTELELNLIKGGLERRKYIQDLWKQFGDIPMDPKTECIESPFIVYHQYGGRVFKNFPAGTHREDIWRWFEEAFCISVAKDLM